jgi:hypothetical protein
MPQPAHRDYYKAIYECESHEPPLRLEGSDMLKDHLQGHLCCHQDGSRRDKTCCSTDRVSIRYNTNGPAGSDRHIWHCNSCCHSDIDKTKGSRFYEWDAFQAHLCDDHGHGIRIVGELDEVPPFPPRQAVRAQGQGCVIVPKFHTCSIPCTGCANSGLGR